MDRNARTGIVIVVAVVTAGLATYGVRQAIQKMPVREVEVPRTFVVAAAHELQVGALLKAEDVKLVPWPERAQIPGSFTTLEPVVNRGVIGKLLENEPVTESKLAPVGAGAGLPPSIPPGMRALSVRVNEVVGVAGFVVPGTRVDVLVTLPDGESNITRVVVPNAQVLTAGTRYEHDKTMTPDAIPSSVVTLLLTPSDAERVVLASTEGQIMLVLRNPLDVDESATAGTRTRTLFGGIEAVPEPARIVAPVARRPRPVAEVAPPSPPAPPPPPPPYMVQSIKGTKRTDEPLH
jgi:pilus assembly protein CpaB